MCLEKTHERLKVQSLDGTTGAPILQGVPRLRSAQDQWTAVVVLEVIGIAGGSKRPLERSFPRDVSLGPRASAETSRCETPFEPAGVGLGKHVRGYAGRHKQYQQEN